MVLPLAPLKRTSWIVMPPEVPPTVKSDVLPPQINLSLETLTESRQPQAVQFSEENVNAYLGPMDDGETADLALLIETIARIDGIGRIRFTTTHPLEFGDHPLDRLRRLPVWELNLASVVHRRRPLNSYAFNDLEGG